MVDFERNVVISKKGEEIPIKRTDNNVRERPNADTRHTSNSVVANNENNLDLVDYRDFEWLAWNYRTHKS